MYVLVAAKGNDNNRCIDVSLGIMYLLTTDIIDSYIGATLSITLRRSFIGEKNSRH